LNPATALGHNILNHKAMQLYYIYLLAPLVGAVLAVLFTYAEARFNPNPGLCMRFA
jgi:hypothetical protein